MSCNRYIPIYIYIYSYFFKDALWFPGDRYHNFVLNAFIIVCISADAWVLALWGRKSSVSHYSDVIMNPMASQITGVSIVYSAVCLGADQRKQQSSASLAFVRGIHRSPVNSPHKGPVTRKMFPFDDVIMTKRSRHRNTFCVIGRLCVGPTGHRWVE